MLFRLTLSFLVAVILSAAEAGQLEFQPCGGSDAGPGQITSISSSQFGGGERILLKKGNVYDFQINFVAGEDAEALTPNIHGIINNVPVQWRGVNTNACRDLVGDGCPLSSGKSYTYSAQVPVLPTYPAVSLTFQWALTSMSAAGAAGNNQICFMMPVTIVN